MIGFAVVAVRRWIGPLEVLQAAPLRMRVQFWVLVVSGVFLASVPVVAQRGDSVPPSSWTPYWPFVATVIVWVFSAGAVWAQFNALKEQISAVEAGGVRKDVLVEMLNALRTEIQAVRQLLERSDREWRDSLHGSKE